MLPILLSLLASSSIHWRLTHCFTITSLLNSLVLSRHLIFEDIGAKEVNIIIIIIYNIYKNYMYVYIHIYVYMYVCIYKYIYISIYI